MLFRSGLFTLAKWCEKCIDLFKKPSDTLYNELINDAKEMRVLINTNNNEFSKILNKYELLKEEHLKETKKKIIKFSFLINLIIYLGDFKFPFFIFGRVLEWLYKFFVKSFGIIGQPEKFSVVGIKRIMSFRQGLKESVNRYKFKLTNDSVDNIIIPENYISKM